MFIKYLRIIKVERRSGICLVMASTLPKSEIDRKLNKIERQTKNDTGKINY